MDRIYSIDYYTYFIAHLLLSNFSIVDLEVLLIYFKGASFLIALQIVTI
jgi:hypothetical protein